MPEFTLHTVDTAPEGARSQLERIEKAWKFVPNLHRTLAESPVTLEAYDTLFGMVARTSFTPAEQQVVFLAASVVNGCAYCVSGHTVLARKAGLQDGVIAALRDASPIADPRLEALRAFTQTVVRERGMAGEATISAFLAAGFTRAQILEVVLIISAKTISNYVNHLAETPLDAFMAETRWTAPRNRIAAA